MNKSNKIRTIWHIIIPIFNHDLYYVYVKSSDFLTNQKIIIIIKFVLAFNHGIFNYDDDLTNRKEAIKTLENKKHGNQMLANLLGSY